MQGFDGLKDLPPIHKSLPQATPEPVMERIKGLALESIRVSAITIQKIRIENGLRTRVERWLVLAAKSAGSVIEITPERAAFQETLNPCFCERPVESAAPGGLLSADTVFVGSRKGVGKVYLLAVVDTFGSYVSSHHR